MPICCHACPRAMGRRLGVGFGLAGGHEGRPYDFSSNAITSPGARGANQLAMDLGSVGGKLGYPTLVVLDENGNKLQAFPGYKDVETLSIILKYFKSGSYKSMDFQQYQTGQ